MERNRRQKLMVIIALVIGIASLSIGFAAFSATLNISSSASVTPSSDVFKVKFSTNQNSLVVGNVAPSSKISGITTTDGVIDNSTNPTIKGLSATFTSPGQYVEYIFYARNEGEYTAYLNNINFLGDKTCTGETGSTASLVNSACDSIIISVTIGSTTYTETTPIEEHTLAKGVGEQIKVRLEYLSSGTAVDGVMSITFPNIALVYSTLNDSSMQPIITKVVKLESGNLNDPGSIVSIGDEQFYVIGQEDGIVKLLSMYNLYVGGKYENSLTMYGSEVTGIQNSNMRGYVSGESVLNGITYYSSYEQHGTTYDDYNGSIVESYVNNYELYLEGLGVNIEETRLITLEELEILGCDSSSFTCGGAPEWVYLTSYWTGTKKNELYMWVVKSDFYFRFYEVDSCFYAGVRPVIEISVSEF